MRLPPAVIVHRLSDARTALGLGLPVTLLSAPGAAVYAGCGWWRALVERVREENPGVPVRDILDCGEASGQAMAALRVRQQLLVLLPSAPSWSAVAAMAEAAGGCVLPLAPPALDLAQPGAAQHLGNFVASANRPG